MRIYLYLARRDKKGIKIITIFPSKSGYSHTRVSDIKSLTLPDDLESSITKDVHENRMLWEPWLEGAENYSDLKKSLIKRGYSNIPLCEAPAFVHKVRIVKSKEERNDPVGKPIKTMIRKKI